MNFKILFFVIILAVTVQGIVSLYTTYKWKKENKKPNLIKQLIENKREADKLFCEAPAIEKEDRGRAWNISRIAGFSVIAGIGILLMANHGPDPCGINEIVLNEAGKKCSAIVSKEDVL